MNKFGDWKSFARGWKTYCLQDYLPQKPYAIARRSFLMKKYFFVVENSRKFEERSNLSAE
ncbi:hypothetical protein NIES1031_20035 [Chroogloeocystis siderophila 5.2 s.c.1]|jgi:hypothetical protein|uniref:Uncharacterized protein n=1 Tax=Chroogloeocystis siderophila 5.2 s.c.1 TaxID=247279 RepID=A0A1U7HFX9_9CHRO|nr:hypothetical protein NIES1031_20035 [Chroogloeocystis siderophila 5.2 s.c.1]